MRTNGEAVRAGVLCGSTATFGFNHFDRGFRADVDARRVALGELGIDGGHGIGQGHGIAVPDLNAYSAARTFHVKTGVLIY